eukprot:GEMP01054278.1.p1 GENE.GEMP01054278.1~~GEMP01054278.1.p1  ORF type:complete len:239 (+),score=57.54 GEMP01054278.1:19-735(+)
MKRRVGQVAFGSFAVLGIGQAVSNYFYPDDGVSLDQRAALVFGIPPQVQHERMGKEQQLRKAKNISEAITILYGDMSIDDVRKRKEKFGNVEWNDEVLDEIRATGRPILEIVAGDGQWANALRDRGVDVVATDNMTALSRSKEPRKGVIKEEAFASIKKYPERLLLMVYPPPGPLCSDLLAAYQGDELIYVGEGLGGVNGDDDFFCEIRQRWNIRKVVELPTMVDSYEKAFFLERIKK